MEDRPIHPDPGTAAPPTWVWSQHWADLLFLHWPVEPALLRPHVPAALELDTVDGAAWVSVVLFRLRVRPRWLPFLPGLSDLVEVNLRTYVRGAGLPGVWFLRMLADNHLAVGLARWLTPLPYAFGGLEYGRLGPRFHFRIRPGSAAAPAAELTFVPIGPAAEPLPGSRDEWLLERYRAFAPRRGALVQAEVSHPRWTVRGVDVSGSANGFVTAVGLDLPRTPTWAHFSPGVAARFGAFHALASVRPGTACAPAVAGSSR